MEKVGFLGDLDPNVRDWRGECPLGSRKPLHSFVQPSPRRYLSPMLEGLRKSIIHVTRARGIGDNKKWGYSGKNTSVALAAPNSRPKLR